MEPPKYSVDKIVKTLNDYEMGWFYKNQQTEDSYFGGEAYEINLSSMPLSENEVRGFLCGNKFIAKNKKFSATIKDVIGEIDAIAIKCTDGIVIIPKEPVKFKKAQRVEGYWYAKYCPQYPKPVPNQISDTEAKEIFSLIKEKEKEAHVLLFRGYSTSRIDGSIVGGTEYHYKEWLWPENFPEHYVLKYKVRPSDDFLKFIGWV